MAGLGFKDFAVGEVLTAGDVDGYLMQQAVMRFADSSARGSALGTASGTGVPLAEGMVSYLDDANAIQVYDGVGWTPVGSILQVVTATDSTDRSSTSSSFANAGISVSVTPKSAASTLYVVWSANGTGQSGAGDSSGAIELQITDSSNAALTGAEGQTLRTTVSGSNPAIQGSITVIGAVAASDTTTRSYKGRFRRANGNDPALINNASSTGRLIVLEVL